ncbi:MAG: hypothetical protein ACYDC1_09740 [Limisphaerales bacterium]
MKCDCTQCGERLEYEEELGGMELECPHCGRLTLLPATAPTLPTPAGDGDTPTTPTGRPVSTGKAREARAYFPPVWIPALWQARFLGILGGLAMLTGALVIAYYWSPAGGTPTDAVHDPNSLTDRPIRVMGAVGLIALGGAMSVGSWTIRLMHVIRSKRP